MRLDGHPLRHNRNIYRFKSSACVSAQPLPFTAPSVTAATTVLDGRVAQPPRYCCRPRANSRFGAYRARAGVATLGLVLRVVALSGDERPSRLSHELTFPRFFLEQFFLGLFTPALSHARRHATVYNEHLTGNGFGSAKC
jgi:hypothetical protein